MGNCCESKSTYHHEVPEVSEYKEERYKLPKIIVTPEDAALIYFDVSPTYASNRFRKSLEHKFPNLIARDGEKRILTEIEMIKKRKYYLIVPGYIREETLRSLLTSSKVKAIYFCLEKPDLDDYSKSSKIKGFFLNHKDLEKAIYLDIRHDEIY